MEEEDGLPSLICHTCLCKVEHTFDFKYQCGVADSILRNYIKSQTFQVSYQIKQKNYVFPAYTCEKLTVYKIMKNS